MFTLPRQSELERGIVVPWIDLRAIVGDYGPLVVGCAFVTFASSHLPAWATMWLLAFAVFFGFKWLTLRRVAAKGLRPSLRRRLAYLWLWVGMDAAAFCAPRRVLMPPTFAEWSAALGKTLLGAILFGCAAPRLLATSPIAAAWVGVVGIVLMLHFGSFQLLALAWRRVGIDVEPIMDRPTAAKSLGEFWSRRWNRAFRDLADDLVYRPMLRRYGARAALGAVFFFSGLVHDFVMSVPARGGYGLPTLYFLIQGAALLVVHTSWGRLCGLHRGLPARLWAIVAVVAPLGLLVHAPFRDAVILPLLRTMPF